MRSAFITALNAIFLALRVASHRVSFYRAHAAWHVCGCAQNVLQRQPGCKRKRLICSSESYLTSCGSLVRTVVHSVVRAFSFEVVTDHTVRTYE